MVHSKNTTSSVLHFAHKTTEAKVYLSVLKDDETTQFPIVIYLKIMQQELLRENAMNRIRPFLAVKSWGYYFCSRKLNVYTLWLMTKHAPFLNATRDWYLYLYLKFNLFQLSETSRKVQFALDAL